MRRFNRGWHRIVSLAGQQMNRKVDPPLRISAGSEVFPAFADPWHGSYRRFLLKLHSRAIITPIAIKSRDKLGHYPFDGSV